MRRIILTLLVAFIALSAEAQHWGPTGYGNNYGRGSYSSDGALSKGYRGMVEGAVSFDYDYGTSGKVFTTHGYQFNPYIYLGGTLGYGGNPYFEHERHAANFILAADARFYMLKKRFTPYVGARLGMEVMWGVRFYLAASIGARYALGRYGISFAVQPGIQMTCLMFGFEF